MGWSIPLQKNIFDDSIYKMCTWGGAKKDYESLS